MNKSFVWFWNFFLNQVVKHHKIFSFLLSHEIKFTYLLTIFLKMISCVNFYWFAIVCMQRKFDWICLKKKNWFAKKLAITQRFWNDRKYQRRFFFLLLSIQWFLDGYEISIGHGNAQFVSYCMHNSIKTICKDSNVRKIFFLLYVELEACTRNA